MSSIRMRKAVIPAAGLGTRFPPATKATPKEMLPVVDTPAIQLVVAEDGESAVVGCLQLCIMPGLSSQGASRGLIEDVRVASHCRSRGIGEQLVQWAVGEAVSHSWNPCPRAHVAPHPAPHASAARGDADGGRLPDRDGII